MNQSQSNDPMNNYKLATFGIVLFLTISSALCQSPPQYSVLDLGQGDAYGINNSGQVVGRSFTLGIAFLYSDGSMTDIGTLGGSNTVPFAINNVGQVVGFSTALIPAPNPCDPNNPNYYGADYCDPDQNPDAPDPNAPYFVERQYAFLYSGGAMINLGTLPGHLPEWDVSSASGINNSGKVVGYSSGVFDPYYGPPSRGFLYSGGSMTDLGDLGYSGSGSGTSAAGINNLGQVVGGSSVGFNQSHPFLYSGGAMIDLGTLGGSSGWAWAINDSGQIVGSSTTAAIQEHAFLYSGGTMTDLGALGGSRSQAVAINNAGQVVGWYYASLFKPFLYTGGHMYDLITLCTDCGTMQEVEPTGINDFGQIVAWGTRPGVGSHIFILSPVAASAVATVSANASYATVAPLTNSNTPYRTTAALLGGNASSNQTVALAFSNSLPASVSAFQTASDVVTIDGTGSDTFVFQVSYNEARAVTAFGTEADARLMWLDPADNQWKLAVAGNIGGSPQFINRAYAPATDFQLGNYGIDTANNVVWAVINHNSYFATGKPPTPAVVYTATVQQPINRDGSSVFNAKRGVVPVKFTLTQNGNAIPTLPAATIGVPRTAGGVVGAINESTYSSTADSGSNFRIDSSQYVYNLAASPLGVGTYRVDIKLTNQVVGSASFQLK
jgi:probable HAF family extracellular repeat protein